MESEIKGGSGLDVTPYSPEPGTEQTSPIDSTPVGEYTNGVGMLLASRWFWGAAMRDRAFVRMSFKGMFRLENPFRMLVGTISLSRFA